MICESSMLSSGLSPELSMEIINDRALALQPASDDRIHPLYRSQESIMKQTLLDWFGTFWRVLVAPTPKTFLYEAKKADGKFASAVVWLVVYALCIFSVASIVAGGMLDIPALLTILFLIPLVVILFTSVLSFICKRIFHQKAYIYDKLLYLTVAILLPGFVMFVLISAFISPDVFKVLIFILLFYQVILLTIAVKGIVAIETWQAFVALVFAMTVGILIGAVLYILILATISPPGLTTPKSQ